MSETRQHRKDLIIQKFNMKPVPDEGGLFSETYLSKETVDITVGGEKKPRNLVSVIYYLLSKEEGERNFINRNLSDIVHFYQSGWPTQYITVSPEGKYEEFVLGPDISNGECFQLTVQGGYFKAARLMSEKTEYESFPGEIPFALIAEAVAPGFDYEDRLVPSKDEIQTTYPNLWEKLKNFIAPKK